MIERKIKKMPDKETLEAYLNPTDGVSVSFNVEEGVFEWIKPRPVELGKPKTELGEKLRKLNWKPLDPW